MSLMFCITHPSLLVMQPPGPTRASHSRGRVCPPTTPGHVSAGAGDPPQTPQLENFMTSLETLRTKRVVVRGWGQTHRISVVVSAVTNSHPLSDLHHIPTSRSSRAGNPERASGAEIGVGRPGGSRLASSSFRRCLRSSACVRGALLSASALASLLLTLVYGPSAKGCSCLRSGSQGSIPTQDL